MIGDSSPARLERALALGRLGAAVLVSAVAISLPSTSPLAAWAGTLALVVSAGGVLWLYGLRPEVLARPALRVCVFAIEAAAGSLLVLDYGWPGYGAWALFILVVVSGTLRWALQGALAAYAVFVLAVIGTQVNHLGAARQGGPRQVLLGSLLATLVPMGAAAFWLGQARRQSTLARTQFRALQAAADTTTDVLSEADRRVRSILDTVADGIITIDENGMIGSANPAALHLFGYSREDLLGQDVGTLIAEPSGSRFTEVLARYLGSGGSAENQVGAREVAGRRRDGTVFPLEFRPNAMITPSGRLYVCNLRDISERKAHMQALEYQAMHDALTGLPNRALFRDRLRQGVARVQRSETVLSLLLLDLDQFKEVNDTLGHHNGDLLLVQMARRIQAELRQSDTVARLGGDEFAVIAGDQLDPGGGQRVAERLLAAMAEPFVIEGTIFHLSASIGIARCPEHGEDPDTLLRHADVAMYQAKRQRQGFAIYSPDQDAHSSERVAMMTELRHALTRGELLLHYQPKIAVGSRTVIGVEALVRWQHPREGLLYPDRFIPVAEETELMWPMTEAILIMALRQYRAWRDAGMEIKVSVNLSADNLRDRGLAVRISELLAQEQVPGSALVLEITESSLMGEGAEHVLPVLVGMGIGLSADDFGTGYSSLAHLKRIPLTELKIDKSFVLRMDSDPDDAAIVRPTIDLAHNMGLRVVAEGVENEVTLEMLRSFGCDMAQGFFIARPMPPSQLAGWLQSSGWSARVISQAAPPAGLLAEAGSGILGA